MLLITKISLFLYFSDKLKTSYGEKLHYMENGGKLQVQHTPSVI